MMEEIRQIVREHARLLVDVDTLSASDDLYQAGLTSHAFIELMMSLEEHFGIEFPERMLRRAAFENLAAIQDSVGQLVPVSASAE
jgi:acyl carrier protein